MIQVGLFLHLEVYMSVTVGTTTVCVAFTGKYTSNNIGNMTEDDLFHKGENVYKLSLL